MSNQLDGTPPARDGRGLPTSFAGGRMASLGDGSRIGLAFAKVVQSSPLTKTVIVSVDGSPVPLCCQVMTDIHSSWGGVSGHSFPAPGTRVVIARSQSLDYGVLLGCLPPIMQASEDGFNHSGMPEARTPASLDPAHNVFDCDLTHMHLESGQYRPEDQYPGEWWKMGDMGSAIGFGPSFASIRGSELAGFEAFALSDKARIFGHRLERFSGDGEARNYADLGVTMSEEFLAPNEALSMGMKKKDAWDLREVPDVGEANLMSGGWGYRKFGGTLPFGVSEIASIPRTSGDRFNLGNGNDIGMSSSVRDFAGNVVEKGAGLVGFVKTPTHPVPSKLFEHDDARGDNGDLFYEHYCDGGYQIDGDLDPSLYFRDMMAWETDRTIGSRWARRAKDWSVPSSKDAPSINEFGAVRNSHQQDGTWYRGVSTEGTMTDDHDQMHDRKCWSSDAWIVVLPNGAISIRDAWGASISMFRGNIEFSASNDIVFHAGRHIVSRSGGDHILHARNNVDLIAQEKQMRIWSKGDSYLSSQEGGILVTTETSGNNKIQEVGEDNRVSGIVLKATNSPVTVLGQSQVFGASSHFMFTGATEEDHPVFMSRASTVLMDTQSGVVVRQGGTREPAAYTTIGNGMWTTGSGVFEDSVWAVSGSVSMPGQVNEAACPSDQWKSLADLMPPAFDGHTPPGVSARVISAAKTASSSVYSIPREGKLKPIPSGEPGLVSPAVEWDSKSVLNGYEREDLDNAWFWFRTEKSYLTDQGGYEWHEKPWEREWVGRADWGDIPRTSHKNGKTAPFPGELGWTTDCLVKATEKNVNIDGSAVEASQMESSPSTTRVNLSKLSRHART